MDIRTILSIPLIYRFFSHMIGHVKAREYYLREHIRAQKDDNILDIGCGPGDILSFLPEVNYTGFDMSQSYIDAANKQFGSRGSFFCARVSKSTVKDTNQYDLVLATGILHHLSDFEAQEMFELAHTVLKPGGRFVTFDGVYMNGQSKIAKYVLSKDRGIFVRTKDEYMKLSRQTFDNVEVSIYNNLLRIPYTHIILNCTK